LTLGQLSYRHQNYNKLWLMHFLPSTGANPIKHFTVVIYRFFIVS